MKFSLVAKKQIKNKVKDLITIDPACKNTDLAMRIGVNRNTISKYREEINSELETKRNLKKAFLIKDLLDRGKQTSLELWEIYAEGMKGDCLYKNPHKLAMVEKMRWDLDKEITMIKLMLETF